MLGWRCYCPDPRPHQVSVSPLVPSTAAGDAHETWLSAGWSHGVTLSLCPPVLVSPTTPTCLPPRQTRRSRSPSGSPSEATLLAQKPDPRPPGSWPPKSRAHLSECQSDSVIHWLKTILIMQSKTHSPPRTTRLPLTPSTSSPWTASRSLLFSHTSLPAVPVCTPGPLHMPFLLPGALPLLPHLFRHPSRFYLRGLPSRTVGLAPSPVTRMGPAHSGARYMFFEGTKAKTLRSLRF